MSDQPDGNAPMSLAPMSLARLLDGIASIPATSATVSDLTLDSRQVRPGGLFFALQGARAHGLQFVPEAVARGASVVLWEPVAGAAAPRVPAGVFSAAIPRLAAHLGAIADRFFLAPSTHLRICGFTGTNGKTTCAYLLAQCLERLGSPAAYIGTLGVGRIGALEPATHTTPDVVSLHRALAKLSAAGVRDVAIEVSSHALSQGRVSAVRFHCAALTNLTRDHLDYHESMQAYAAAKARLFVSPGLEHLIINVGDDFGRELAERHGSTIPLTAVWVGAGAGFAAQHTLHAAGVHTDARGITLALAGSFGQVTLRSRLVGRFNAENAVVVLGTLLALGVPMNDAVEALAGCTAPPGRMEVVPAVNQLKPLTVVDYAHTPDGLAKALAALREHCDGQLWCVFGCGGDRDPGKRPIMGQVADELADRLIVTDDNPRSENPEAITQAIAQGITAHPVDIIHDRAEAIATALRRAAPVDAVLIAGKGHEDYQIYGQTRRAFSDRSEARRSLGEAA
jgi:UDP-N-acetylmuramoyl-L-alanyl-D-glutamate--2,6-diaminopimelate ligase